MIMQDNFDLDGVTEAEKVAILKVLKRNDELKQREDRRLKQLAVRVQMERMGDARTTEDDGKIIGKTGLWHKILRNERFPQDTPEAASSLHFQITQDMLQRTRRAKTPVQSPLVNDITDRDDVIDDITEKFATKLPSVEAWVETQSPNKEVFVPNGDLFARKRSDDVSLSFGIAREQANQREI